MKSKNRNSVALADQKGYSAVICILNSDFSSDEMLYMGYVCSNLEIIMTVTWNCKCTKCSVCTSGWVL
jgi:hypothetical protein